MPLGRPRIGRLAIQFGAIFALLMGAAGVTIYYVAQNLLVENVDHSLDRERDRLVPPIGASQPNLMAIEHAILRLESGRTITDKVT
jgi:hypothetical protein